MRFATPQYFGLIIIPILILVLSFYAQHVRSKRLQSFIRSPLWSKVLQGHIPGARLRRTAIFVIALVIGIISIARPQWGTVEETVKITGLDIMVVLDISSSMLVEDVPPNRLKKAKHILRNVIGGVIGDRVGATFFAGSSYLACPLTTDLDYVIENLEGAEPELIQNQGTNIGSALETSIRALDAGAQDSKQSSRVILLVTDGEDHEAQARQLAPTLVEKGILLLIVGVGTEGGGPIPIREESSGRVLGYKRDGRDAVVSKFDSKTLITLAADSRGVYWNASTEETEVAEIQSKLRSLARGDLQEKKIVQYKDRYQIFLMFMVALLFYELFIPLRAIRRPGTVIALLLSLSSLATAASSPESYFENQKGLEQFAKENPDGAIEHFQKAQKDSPQQGEFLFNEGVMHLKKQDFERAIQKFNESRDFALKSGNKDLAAQSRFNEGVARTQAQQSSEAIQSYLQAADLARQANNEPLLQDAKKNIELLNKKMEQQKKQEKKDQEKKEKESDQQKPSDQKKEQDQKQDQKSDQKSDPKDGDGEEKTKPQSGSEQKQSEQKKQFRSLKLSQEDAERVMAELSNREKQLQTKLKKQKSPQGRNTKDW